MKDNKYIKSTNDIVSDTLTRIRNAIKSKKNTVIVPLSKLVLEILKVMHNYKFIGDYQVIDKNAIEVNLLVDSRYKISELVRVSKPGLRIYVKSKDIKPVKYGYGIGIYSTSQGVVSHVKARKMGIGGEYICYIW
ncbi:MAG: 30S ribosomal protein S8 [Candidatus Dojkabacteria bacterium]|nr:30S ribosomal protein S8 [Candidatus Dojkabacteria bacterium]